MSCRAFGASSVSAIGPRSHARPKSQDSVQTLSNPYSRNLSTVHLFARWTAGDPVNRGPITSDRYCKSAPTCERCIPSASIARTAVLSGGSVMCAWATWTAVSRVSVASADATGVAGAATLGAGGDAGRRIEQAASITSTIVTPMLAMPVCTRETSGIGWISGGERGRRRRPVGPPGVRRRDLRCDRRYDRRYDRRFARR